MWDLIVLVLDHCFLFLTVFHSINFFIMRITRWINTGFDSEHNAYTRIYVIS